MDVDYVGRGDGVFCWFDPFVRGISVDFVLQLIRVTDGAHAMLVRRFLVGVLAAIEVNARIRTFAEEPACPLNWGTSC